MYLSANRFPSILENGIRTSSSVFRLPTSSEKGIRDSVFVFRFPTPLPVQVKYGSDRKAKAKNENRRSKFLFPNILRKRKKKNGNDY